MYAGVQEAQAKELEAVNAQLANKQAASQSTSRDGYIGGLRHRPQAIVMIQAVIVMMSITWP